MIWAEQATIDEKASVGGSIMVGTQDAELDGHAGGDVLAFVADLTINGRLDRDLTIRGDRLTIGSTAQIGGKTKYEGRGQPDIASGAKLASPIQITIPKRGPDYTRVAYYWHQVLFWGANFLFGLVLLLLLPGFFSDAVHQTRRVGPAVGFGALFLFATPIAIIIVCVTIVGLGIGISALLLYLISLYAAQLFVGSWLGEQLLGYTVGIGPAVARLAIGLALLRVLRMIPFVGPLAGFIIIIWGLGALVLAAYGRMHAQSSRHPPLPRRSAGRPPSGRTGGAGEFPGRLAVECAKTCQSRPFSGPLRPPLRGCSSPLLLQKFPRL